MHSNRVSVRPGGSKTSPVVTGGHQTSFGTGQSQHPLQKVSDRRLRFSDWIAGSGKIRISLGAREGLQLPGQYARKARLGAVASIKPLPKSLGGSVGSPHGKSLDISAIFQVVAALDSSPFNVNSCNALRQELVNHPDSDPERFSAGLLLRA